MLARMPQVLEVWKDQIGLARVANVEPAAIVEGQARFEVERFGLTANNVTYALFGDRMLYWTFFPSDADGWGRVPAWGFATVVESRSADVREGGRIYGFVQMGGDLVLTPERVDDQRFQDRSAHRAGLPAAYLSYRFAEPSERDDATMLLQPLLVTAILLARSLEGASRVVFSSACSKTALATTYLLARRAVETAGITSSADVVSSLGVYDEVVGYDPIEGLQCGPATFVDLLRERRRASRRAPSPRRRPAGERARGRDPRRRHALHRRSAARAGADVLLRPRPPRRRHRHRGARRAARVERGLAGDRAP